MGALSWLGGELVDVNARLEAEGLRLAREWHQLKVAINLGHLQHERARADAAASLAASREACARALEEARAADRRREAAEEREKELRASNATLERQVQERRATLAAPPSEAPSDEKGGQAREDALALEITEHNLELERLELRERQVAAAEDAVATREAKIQQEVDRRVAEIRGALVGEYHRKLRLQETRFQQRQVEL
jgi:hypothetical protein